MSQGKSTMVELVEELEKIPEPRGALVEEIIQEAKAGEYHDYKNNKYPCGKVAANELLTRAGLINIARDIRMGVYDEKPDAEDKAMMRKTCIEGGMSERMMSILGLDK